MADNVAITAGSGTIIASDDVSGVQFQKMKLDIGGDGVSKPLIQGGTDGIPVDILTVAGQVYVTTKPKSGETWPVSAASALPVSDNSGSITVDAPVGTPVFVRLSDGSAAITTLPVSGTVTAGQGTAAANSGAWPVKISDGTSAVGITDVGGAKAIKVDVIQSVALAGALADSATFTAASTQINVMGGVYNDGVASPSSGQAAAARITALRAVHINLRKNDGTELGTSTAPVRVDVTGTTTQPVSQGTAAAASGAWFAKLTDGTSTVGVSSVSTARALKTDIIQAVSVVADLAAFTAGTDPVGIVAGIYNDSATAPTAGQTAALRLNAKRGLHTNLRKSDGTEIAFTAPLAVELSSAGQTRITKNIAAIASQTAATMWSPTGSNFIYITKVIISATVAGTLTIFGGTNSEANIFIDGNQATGNRDIDFGSRPWKSTAGGDVLKYTSGTGLVAEVVFHGYESAT